MTLRWAVSVTLFLLASACMAASITVTTTSDDVLAGDGCSLREAIMSANGDLANTDCQQGDPGADTIAFNIPPGDLEPIVTTNNYPVIIEPLHIDARTQPGATCPAGQLIELRERGLVFDAGSDGSGVSGIRVTGVFHISTRAPELGNSGEGIFIDGYALRIWSVNGFHLRCSVFGWRPDGSRDPNGHAVGVSIGDGIILGVDPNHPDPSDRNTFSSVSRDLEVQFSSQIRVSGNWFGVNPTGDIAQPNSTTSFQGISSYSNTDVVVGVVTAEDADIQRNWFGSTYLYSRLDSDLRFSGNVTGFLPQGNTPIGAIGAVAVDYPGSNITIGVPENSADYLSFANRFAGAPLAGLIIGVYVDGCGPEPVQVLGNLLLGNPTNDEDSALWLSGNACAEFRNNAIIGWGKGIDTVYPNNSPQLENSTGNCIQGNLQGADSWGQTLNLGQNWWGSFDGPGGEGPGSGDPVSPGVQFEPFLNTPPDSCALAGLAPRTTQAIPVLSGHGVLLFLILILVTAPLGLRFMQRRRG